MKPSGCKKARPAEVAGPGVKEKGATDKPTVNQPAQPINKIPHSAHQTALPGECPPVESVENVENSSVAQSDPGLEKAIFPANSWLARYMDWAREREESADSLLLGSILPIMAGCLARNAWFPWHEGRKYPNLFAMLCANPAMRKSAAILLALRLAQAVVKPNRFLTDATSAEGLFDQFDERSGGSPDKLLVLDDANPFLGLIAESNYGKRVGQQFLRLYDCGGMSESFRGNREEGRPETQSRQVPETSTSVVLGATFNVCRFTGQQIQSGLQRRFNYYVATRLGSIITLPPMGNPSVMKGLTDRLAKLCSLREIEFSFSPGARDLWNTFQYANRARLSQENPSDDAQTARLNCQPIHVLKLCMLFEAALWLEAPEGSPLGVISLPVLTTAMAHSELCVASAKALDTLANRSRNQNEADVLLAYIDGDFKLKAEGGWITLTRTDLVRKYCPNSHRRGAWRPDDLYYKFIPDLIRRGKAKEVIRPGKPSAFAFHVESDSEPAVIQSRPPAGPDLTALAVRIGGWFKRKESMTWMPHELEALGMVAARCPTEEELSVLEAYYTAPMAADKDWRKQDVLGLLKDWNTQLDRARRWDASRPTPTDFTTF